jgi:hypothetical protein
LVRIRQVACMRIQRENMQMLDGVKPTIG